MTDTDRPFSEPVAVTGASGYVASWVVRELLTRGATVHGTVRDPSREDKVGHLHRLAEELPGTLQLFPADLLEQGSFDAAFADCGSVIHTASPFFIGSKDPQKELIDPALEGTRNVFDSIERTPSVTRVVLTSSVVAVFGDFADIPEGERIDETRWNETSSVDHQPYAYSKTVAERAAWEAAEAQDRWTLATINPGFVFGPSLTRRKDSTSIDFLIKLLDGTRKSGMPRLGSGFVDVREVAEAHVQAALRRDVVGRHLLVARYATYADVAAMLRERFPDRPLPSRTLPGALAYVIGPFVGLSWKFLRKNMNVPRAFDTTRSQEQLGITYRPLAETFADHAEQVIADGLV